ncbi:MAG: hypothetical protein CSA62_13015 [Planctomycetota bacterium]|nr:MAG: hypothetical protein CSA62_13015 [Planctomycetota bacterium]
MRIVFCFLLVLASLSGTEARAQVLDDSIDIFFGRHETRLDGDRMHLVIRGAFRLRYGNTVLRAGRGVLSFDRDEFYAWLRHRGDKENPLPRRSANGPDLRPRPRVARALGLSVLDLLGAPLGESAPMRPSLRRLSDLVQQLHLVDGVVVERAGVQHLRCRELFLSVPSRRVDARDAEIRFPVRAQAPRLSVPLFVKAPRILQQGARLLARDAIFAASDQGSPGTRVRAAQLMITRLDEVFEIHAIGNELLLGSLPALPLPDLRRYSDDDSSIPVKGFQGGVSDSRGHFALVQFGGRFHQVGQALFNWALSEAPRFRGNWRLRTGWMEKRGVPLEPQLDYELEGVFQGDFDSMFLDDSGTDMHSPILWLDGSAIETGMRHFERTRNRFVLSENTTLDLEIFHAADPGIYPEFRQGRLLDEEAPETVAYLRWAEGNLRGSLSGRWSLNDFAYGDDGLLTSRYRREEPEARFDVFEQPLLQVTDDVPLLSSFSFRAGRLSNEVVSRAPGLVDQSSDRIDARVEVSAPVVLGDWGLRFFASARETWYSELADGDEGGREVFEAGALLSTRWSREYPLEGSFLALESLQHELLPQLRLLSRFDVSRSSSELYAFDEVEDLDELHAIDLVLLQRFSGVQFFGGKSSNRELLWLDIEQRLHPAPDRDHGGKLLGLFKWELIFRPTPRLAFLWEGERDWERRVDRIRNLELATRPLDWLSLGFGWRAGSDAQGVGRFSAGLDLWRRWLPYAEYVYDFENSTSQSWSVGISRFDYDWEFGIRMQNDVLSDDRSFSLTFRPVLGQRLRARRLSGFENSSFGLTSRSAY